MEEKTLKEIYDAVDRKRWGGVERRADLGSVQRLQLIRDPSAAAKIPRGPVTTPSKALSMFREFYRDVSVEVISVMSLNAHNEYLGLSPVGVGSMDHVEFDPWEIIKVMALHNASCCIVAHNHPSGKTVQPSDEDRTAMLELKFLLDRLRKPMRDFMVIGFEPDGGVQYFSYRDEGYEI